MRIVGRRVVLRPFRADEVDVLFEARRRVALVPTERPGARRRVQALVAHSGRLWQGRLDLAIELDGRLVGEIDARSPPSAYPPGVYELGISVFGESDRARGVGRDAVETLTTHLFTELGAGRVQASTAVDNAPMRAVLRRLGFVEEGIMRGFMPCDDGRDDYALYAVTRQEWAARAP